MTIFEDEISEGDLVDFFLNCRFEKDYNEVDRYYDFDDYDDYDDNDDNDDNDYDY